ncbi:hypothetical protein M9H77_28565 [Catharanthus roseus]|uniref:Uncharacterized protein n=1 Tax=Catharanthus roseus TaxID=4058 RepID=A0ACC0AFP5_CATRO|nr:hypothetical protein M9H77_28565 [Catharanthus roseus]
MADRKPTEKQNRIEITENIKQRGQAYTSLSQTTELNSLRGFGVPRGAKLAVAPSRGERVRPRRGTGGRGQKGKWVSIQGRSDGGLMESRRQEDRNKKGQGRATNAQQARQRRQRDEKKERAAPLEYVSQGLRKRDYIMV